MRDAASVALDTTQLSFGHIPVGGGLGYRNNILDRWVCGVHILAGIISRAEIFLLLRILGARGGQFGACTAWYNILGLLKGSKGLCLIRF